MGRTCFRLPHGDCGRVAAITETCYDTTNDEVLQFESGSLQCSTNDHDGSTEENHAPTTERITDEDGDNGTDEASQVVRCHSNALVGGAFGRISVVNSGSRVDDGELVKEDG